MEGISFIVKVRNEEATLEAAVRSLFELVVVYEILIILHRCVDASAAIAARLAAENPRIRILHYTEAISRPGYETLATDAESRHSLIRYYNWCRQQARYVWHAKWDADFVAPVGLVQWINAAGIWGTPNQIVRIAARSDGIEWGDYFSSCLSHYFKDVFWETPYYVFDPSLHVKHVLTDVWIEHRSAVAVLKEYWREEPWFWVENTTEALTVRERVALLAAEFGPEERGTARGGSLTSAVLLGQQILDARPAYVDFFS
jgi:hypothetical protein